MLQNIDNTPKLKSLEQRKWFILIFWLYILGGIVCLIFTNYMFFEDVEVFVLMILFTSTCFYKAYLYKKAFDGFGDWEMFQNSKIDIDELFEIENIEDEEEKQRRKKEIEEREEEYTRIWKVTWDLKLLNRKEEIYLKKVEKKRAEFDKKRKKLEQDLIPRCKGIKM